MKQYLVFVLPKLKAGETITVDADDAELLQVAPPQFEFVEKKASRRNWSSLVDGKRTVLQYFNLPHDPKDHFYTFKPFHNVYDPATGKVLLTNSLGQDRQGRAVPAPPRAVLRLQQDHLRRQADRRHLARHGQRLHQHDKTLSTEAGEVLGRQRSRDLVARQGRQDVRHRRTRSHRLRTCPAAR